MISDVAMAVCKSIHLFLELQTAIGTSEIIWNLWKHIKKSPTRKYLNFVVSIFNSFSLDTRWSSLQINWPRSIKCNSSSNARRLGE